MMGEVGVRVSVQSEENQIQKKVVVRKYQDVRNRP